MDCCTAPKVDVRDPVCGMTVDPAKAKGMEEHAGAQYYFCGLGCAARFRAEPEKYLQPRVVAPPLKTELETEYICPMDPEVSRMGPGSCPKCGMALEPREISAVEDHSELRDMTRRLWISVG